ncbi:hypothetical protein DEJ15_08210 [Curtobacterium sp. MCJR17_043]|nr:hypothetical protein [Curtobacterium sp. MCJR17_043]WIB36927.1 hypothetical protein DEJ15_08210 [Curtobacterium sp. MCJR17_043]
MRTIDPPPTPTVRTSSADRYVELPPNSVYCTATLPRRITEMSVEVPPVSRKSPSLSFSCMSAPATPAAGPDSTVSSGRRRISSRDITPPSHRITMSGAVIPAASMLAWTRSAVANIRGRITALRTAVRVRLLSPYSDVISCVAVTRKPRWRAAAATRSSPIASSTENGSVTTTDSMPAAWNRSRTPASAASSSACRRCSYDTGRRLPSAISIRPSRRSRFAKKPAGPRPMPIIPTGATSPSSSAFVAWVVPCARNTTSPGDRPIVASSSWSAVTMPCATPSGWSWLVGVLAWPMSRSVAASMATASVNVPPTSMPMRSALYSTSS